ncbi:MAG: PP2C family protein-serine/threonine phosphatase [Thermoanaerobaculia bacterium]|nr:PP2C family protein-serine/threonine phosphatase [Thermoanaerobaculia bacterium]
MTRASRAARYVDRTRRFLVDYTQGLNVRDFKQLFDRDAPQAYAVLARDQETELPEGRLARLAYGAKVVFLGISAKLSPVRRILFAGALVAALLGVLRSSSFQIAGWGFSLSVEASLFWFSASVALLVFLLVVELVDRVRVRDELEVARQLQADLMPQSSPDLAGYDFAHSYRNANEVGGDYYDFQTLPGERLALIVGDASGHGIAAGLLMAIANATLKTAIDVDPSPQRVAALLNRSLFRTGDRRAFMTLFYGLLDPATGRLEYVCAGHPFPLLRQAGGVVRELGTGTLPLGLRPEIELPTGEARLEPGDLLVLFTDGLVESIAGGSGESFGFDRLRRVIGPPGSPAKLHDRILQEFDRHVGNEPVVDDLTLVLVGRRPVSAPQPAPVERS